MHYYCSQRERENKRGTESDTISGSENISQRILKTIKKTIKKKSRWKTQDARKNEKIVVCVGIWDIYIFTKMAKIPAEKGIEGLKIYPWKSTNTFTANITQIAFK